MINAPATQPEPDDGEARQEAVARLLDAMRDGRREALDELIPLIYGELRELAQRQRGAWQGDETLNTTALVHEAYLKLVDQRRAEWDSGAHFLAAASRAIRHILIDYARTRQAQKRGGDWRRVTLTEHALLASSDDSTTSWEDRVLALDDALVELARRSSRQASIVECKFFGGMTVEQTATALDLSTATVVRGWAMARAWLRREMGDTAGDETEA